MNEPMSQEDFELACAECEGVKVSTIKAWRNSTGGYSNEKIDDMYLGYSLATAALEKQKAITRRVSAESNRLFDEKAVLIKQLEEAERERDELRREKQNDNRYQELLKLGTAVVYECDAAVQRAEVAEAELARRAAAAGEPVAWQYRYNDGKVGDWHTVDSESECNHLPCYERRPIYTAAQPAVLPPEMINADAPCDYSSEETFAWVAGANWMREQCLALGAQQQNVVELPTERKNDDVAYGGSGAFSMGKNSGFNECLNIVHSLLDTDGVKWEVMK